jgi:hypothetical protein
MGLFSELVLRDALPPAGSLSNSRPARGSPYEHEGRSHTLRTENWAAAVVDRLTFNAHIINTGTASYRLRTTKEQRP